MICRVGTQYVVIQLNEFESDLVLHMSLEGNS